MKINTLFVFLFTLTFVGCATVDTEKIENLHDGQILKLGHGGLGFASFVNPFNPYPINGITAITKAMEYGADGVEVDLQMTKDSVLVLFHDLKLEESSNLQGCILDKTWDELKNGEYKIGPFFDMFHSDKILRLDSLLSLFGTFDEHPHIHFDTRIGNICDDTNPHAFNNKMAPALSKMLDDYEVPKEKVLIISTSLNFMMHMKDISIPYPISYESTADFERGLTSAIELGFTSMTVKPKLLTAEKVALAHSHNIEIVTFGGKSKGGTARLINLNPDAIHSNNIRAMVEFLSD